VHPKAICWLNLPQSCILTVAVFVVSRDEERAGVEDAECDGLEQWPAWT